ncbi:RNA polymerase sigma-70 factor (ECF subfamily) [Parabacteroides sp. PF5-5]|uniref:RNA polymerase sigma-70 factor n=1 Tax=unclassified Parabacteroides TaxID=2649774 RepID=UPI002477288D|nr:MULTISPECIES: RNA polymerase sigma-70 factor [unclassified Parabacteroides]MDH6305816.1 RNA polymerase sigma-70 factor (ECF subfamily) [Parabacteroides sp. PH5-39]MDH6317747.1 RNA polymerase sigma-70 factor (ECF subfamily) [Parabacteroides sp. PF5-13]MDH6320578.1 RNA polymerase sigma-70 factor (ECF subfamily) [Parabacteroides sp. PH5-13]MDH6324259.1 RNA polymerase sigma-70 factor (ECF subfamily) [Parabacteroides sp. PH5-8]MDH6328932.1 RNA polymerase sigma-70 factor (ECF subfamily) [Parabact
MNNEEHKIILMLKQGENAAYKYIYDHHYALLCAIANEYLQDSFLAKTIVEDLIFHLWEKRDTLTITSSLRAYLVRSVRNRSINHLNLQREKVETNFSEITPSEEIKIHTSLALDYPSAILLENELEEKINQAIENLPTETKAVFKMSRYEDKGYKQIANETGISVNTVKYHIKKALTLLKQDLSKYL